MPLKMMMMMNPQITRFKLPGKVNANYKKISFNFLHISQINNDVLRFFDLIIFILCCFIAYRK